MTNEISKTAMSGIEAIIAKWSPEMWAMIEDGISVAKQEGYDINIRKAEYINTLNLIGHLEVKYGVTLEKQRALIEATRDSIYPRAKKRK